MQSIKKKLTTVFYQRLRISIDNSTLLKNKKKITNVNDNFHMHFFLVNFKDIKRILHIEFLNKYKILKYKPKPLRQAV